MTMERVNEYKLFRLLSVDQIRDWMLSVLSGNFHWDVAPDLHLLCINKQGGRGHLVVYYTGPQSFIISFLIRWLNNFGKLLWNFDCGNFLDDHLGCSSIYCLTL